jgi:hypothetical protein
MSAVSQQAELSITIDGITFQLHAASYENKRHHILYTSNSAGITQQFYVAYKSNSEGFWRLASMTGNQYYKGTDYVTTTFLHMELQHFLEVNYNKLPQKEFLMMYVEHESKRVLDEIQKGNQQENLTKNRQVYDPYFARLAKYCPSPSSLGKSCLADLEIFEKELNPRPKFIRSNSMNSNYTPNYSPEIIKIMNISKLESSLPELNTEFRKLYKSYKESHAEKELDEDDFVAIMSLYLQTYFDVDTSQQKYLFDMKLEFHVEGGSHGSIMRNEFFIWGEQSDSIVMKIYKTEIRNKQTGQKYILFYCIYNYKGAQYKGIVNVVPVEATVLPNGTYSKYISAGIFIYKIFDYIHQCHMTKSGRESCEVQYVFLGDTMKNMWPLPLLGGGGAAAATSGGRRKKTRRVRRSRRMSRRQKK